MRKTLVDSEAHRTLNVDRFSLIMFSVMILVIIVVSSSQYQQFNLASTAVKQNTIIYHAVLTAIKELNYTDHKIASDGYKILNNITTQHDTILDYVQQNSLYNIERLNILKNLSSFQSDDILKKLDNHTKSTAMNLNLTKINTYYLKDTNTILHKILSIMQGALLNQSK